MKKLTAQERFERFKEKIKREALNDFLRNYTEFKQIEEDLLKEMKESIKDG
jgi:hypothetical protein